MRTIVSLVFVSLSSVSFAIAPRDQEIADKGPALSCVVFDVDGSCLVNSKQAKGNDYNDYIDWYVMDEYCRTRATSRNERRWCEQLGFATTP